MPRSRNIKPSLFKNELLGVDEADPLLTLLFASLWCLADREGRLEDRPLRIKAETFPYRTLEQRVFNGYLTELERLGFIRRFVVDGTGIIQVVNFAEHQHPHPTEKQSELPPEPADYKADTDVTVKYTLNNGEPNVDARLIPDSFHSDSLIEESVCIGAEPKKPTETKPKPVPFPSDFAITDEMRSWAKDKVPNLDIDDELEEFCGYWRDVDNGKTKRTEAGWRQTWQGRMRDVYKRTPRARAQPHTNGKAHSNGNGYDPTKDIMSSEYIMPSSRLTFEEAALIYFDSHHDDGTREKYEQMKINWLETASGKGHEDEIEEYERTYRFRQRFSEAG